MYMFIYREIVYSQRGRGGGDTQQSPTSYLEIVLYCIYWFGVSGFTQNFRVLDTFKDTPYSCSYCTCVCVLSTPGPTMVWEELWAYF
jgi:hypothetical protein